MLRIQENINLSDKNTFRIGGKTLFYAAPASEDELKDAFAFASENGVQVFVLGKGSNVLISDRGWPGLTINTSMGMNRIQWDGTRVTADCGVLLNSLVNQAIEYGCSGMEELSGIPGTVGGAVLMNAGAFNNCIADTFESAEHYDVSKGVIDIVNVQKASFGYRSSIFKNSSGLILSATFNFTSIKTADELKIIQRDILSRRKIKQPLEYPNCGSVFKRPEGNFAGTLIEMCGLKGLQSGDMQVSGKHANFIINKGNGRAEDVRNLIWTVQNKVYEQYGILLEPEVLFIGEFETPILLKDQS